MAVASRLDLSINLKVSNKHEIITKKWKVTLQFSQIFYENDTLRALNVRSLYHFQIFNNSCICRLYRDTIPVPFTNSTRTFPMVFVLSCFVVVVVVVVFCFFFHFNILLHYPGSHNKVFSFLHIKVDHFWTHAFGVHVSYHFNVLLVFTISESNVSSLYEDFKKSIYKLLCINH